MNILSNILRSLGSSLILIKKRERELVMYYCSTHEATKDIAIIGRLKSSWYMRIVQEKQPRQLIKPYCKYFNIFSLIYRPSVSGKVSRSYTPSNETPINGLVCLL